MRLFSERLQYLLDSRRIGQKDLVEGVDVDKAQVSNWLSGKVSAPRRTTIHKLAGFFGCDIEWLATGMGKAWPDAAETPYLIEEEHASTGSRETEAGQVRMYRELAQMDEDALREIQTWLDDMERIRPGFKGWFRLEFQNRFPEFDEWKEKILSGQRKGSIDDGRETPKGRIGGDSSLTE